MQIPRLAVEGRHTGGRRTHSTAPLFLCYGHFMMPETRMPIVETCRKTSLLLDEILPSLIPWALEDGAILRLFSSAVARTRVGEKFPKEWVQVTASQLAAGSVVRDPARIEAYLAAKCQGLSPEAAQLLHALAEHPAFYTAFSAEEALGEDLFQIRDFSTDQTQVLSSPSMAELFKQGAPSQLSLLFSNGACLQAIGPLHYYRGFQSFDFHYYARMLRPESYEKAGLSAVMTELPQDFIILDAFSEIPAVGHKGEILYSCSATLSVNSFDPSAFSASFDLEEVKGKVKCILKGSDSPFTAGRLYWDQKKHELFIYARNRAQYAWIAMAIFDQVEVPPEPQWYATQNMEVAAHSLLGRQLPIVEWDRDFEQPPPSPEEKQMLERTNALLRELVDAANHGRSYDLQQLAARHSLPVEVAQQAERVLEQQARSMSIAVDGGLEAIPFLPPAARAEMKGPLGKCPLFRFDQGSDAQRLFGEVASRIEAMRGKERISRSRTALTLVTLAKFLEEIDDEAGDDKDNTVLKYSLYLLLHAGGELQSTKDYAAEILKLFWQVLLQSGERVEIRRFTKQYAIWCREFLVRTGLAEEELDAVSAQAPQKPGAAFRLKATDFFRAWVKPAQA
jgi:hypothetical protein